MKEERNKTLQQQTTDKYHRFQVVTITGKRQPGGPGRSDDAGKCITSLEDVAEMEGATPTKQRKTTAKPARGGGKGRGKGKCRGRGKKNK